MMFGFGVLEFKFVFWDCVFVKKGLMVGDVVRKVMGDVFIVYVEGFGNIWVLEDDFVVVGKNDVGLKFLFFGDDDLLICIVDFFF